MSGVVNYAFERNIFEILGRNNDEFIGESYLILNGIHKNWFPLFLQNEDLLCSIFAQLQNETFYPEYNNIFNAFQMDPLKIKVVLLGQDPYINIGEAHGYSFSVPPKKNIPPSLINIFKEINAEFPGKYNFTHGCLTKWSRENGVFLLNSALTVKPKKSNSHSEIWSEFTDNVIKYISEKYENIVFLLLGGFAKKKSVLINDNKHEIVCGVHPSPLSAHNGFFGSNIFKIVDIRLLDLERDVMNWQN